jgi:hypothetical protein
MPKYRKRMTGNYAEKIPMENVDEGQESVDILNFSFLLIFD